MDSNYQNIIEEIIKTSKLTGRDRRELRLELLSHFIAEIKELRAQGNTEEQAKAIVLKQFGTNESIGGQLRVVHWRSIIYKKIAIVVALAPAVAILLSFLMVSFIFLFSPIFIGFTLVVASLALLVLKHPALLRRLSDKPIVIVQIIFSFAIIALWLSVFLSGRDIVSGAGQTLSPVGVGGFPFKAINYQSGFFRDHTPPVFMSVWFFVNYIFWLIIIAFFYPLIPKKIKTNKVVQMAITAGAAAITIVGFGFLLLKFD